MDSGDLERLAETVTHLVRPLVLLTGHYSNLRDEFQKLAVDLETLARDEFRTS